MNYAASLSMGEAMWFRKRAWQFSVVAPAVLVQGCGLPQVLPVLLVLKDHPELRCRMLESPWSNSGSQRILPKNSVVSLLRGLGREYFFSDSHSNHPAVF